MSRYFPLEEYEDRWRRVYDEMHRRGYETAVVWGRSGGSYERCGDILYLANYYSQASGQGLDNAIFNARAFSALILHDGEMPELQADEPWPRKDLIATDCVDWHHDPIKGVADALKRRKTVGRVAIVGSDILPMKYWHQLRSYTPCVEWEPEDDLVLAVRRSKSSREIACMREAGAIASLGLNCLMERLIAGQAEAIAAAAAAQRIIEMGGAIHMMPCSHGDMIKYWCRNPLTGYGQEAPQSGDYVRGWIYGPMREGYWLDPGRTAVCGGKPSSEQKDLIETNVEIVETLIGAVRPGVRVLEVAELGQQLVAAASPTKDQAAEKWPHFGHGMGLFFETPYIGVGMCKMEDVFQASTVIGIEAFVSNEGGSSGVEENFVVHEDHNERLTTAPLIWW